MKIVLTSDTHIGITDSSHLVQLFRDIAAEKPDVVIHAGDYCGDVVALNCVKDTVKIMGAALGDTPILTTLGNHDFWCGNTRTFDFLKSQNADIAEVFKDAGIHFLDKDGIYIHPDFPAQVFVGHTGWYVRSMPPTNDSNWMPLTNDVGTGIHAYMLGESFKDIADNFDGVDQVWEPDFHELIFVSHFGVVKSRTMRHGNNWEAFNWSTSIADYVKKHYNCKYFLQGHSHQTEVGPMLFNCGSDYYVPRYSVIEV